MAIKMPPDESEMLNLTPFIDVVFNLLIFFLLSSTFMTEQQTIELELPSVAAAQPVTDAPDEIQVNVRRDGVVEIAEKTMTLAELSTFLQEAVARYPDQAVAVRGDKTVPYERVAEVVAACRTAKISKLDLFVWEK